MNTNHNSGMKVFLAGPPTPRWRILVEDHWKKALAVIGAIAGLCAALVLLRIVIDLGRSLFIWVEAHGTEIKVGLVLFGLFVLFIFLLKNVRFSSDWRDDPATDKQYQYLERLGYDGDEDLTKGEASAMIDELKLSKKSRRKQTVDF